MLDGISSADSARFRAVTNTSSIARDETSSSCAKASGASPSAAATAAANGVILTRKR